MSEGLGLAEAVPLGYAYVLRAAEDVGVRALGIKGPALAIQGVRESKPSVDVDVLVEPTGRARLLAEMERLGWVQDVTALDTPGILPPASVPLRHPMWPCEVDLHDWFPGFLADRGEVFDVLWRRRATVTLAHSPVRVPDHVAHTAVHALHHLRDATSTTSADRVERLAVLIETTWPAAQVAELAELAADTGAADTLAPLLRRVGAPVVATRTPLAVPLGDWEMRAHMESQEVLRWVVGLQRTPWRQRPRFLWRALWLDEEHLLLDGEQPTTPRDRMAARWRRVKRAWRALPAAYADYRRSRRP